MAAPIEAVEVKSRAELRRWLEQHHAQAESIWLVTWKKQTPHHLPYPELVEETLCFGWIDSQPRTLDDDRDMIRLSPRKPKRGWSAVNKKRVAALISDGRMAPAGLAVIEAARPPAPGTSWTTPVPARCRPASWPRSMQSPPQRRISQAFRPRRARRYSLGLVVPASQRRGQRASARPRRMRRGTSARTNEGRPISAVDRTHRQNRFDAPARRA
jgi:hypothetical protein